MYVTNAILFPYHALATVKQLRGPAWQELVEEVLALPETHPDAIALMLTLVRLNGCAQCETDSFRAMRGCVACAQQTLRRFKGSDDELIAAFERARVEVTAFMAKRGLPTVG